MFGSSIESWLLAFLGRFQFDKIRVRGGDGIEYQLISIKLGLEFIWIWILEF
jgi:hypothetical protein